MYMTMFNQPPFSVRLWMRTTKCQCWESAGITIHFHIFVWNIIITLNMIPSICPFSFTVSFPVFPLINKSMFTIILRQMFLELFSQTDNLFWCEIMHYNMFFKYFWSWKFNNRHYLIHIALVNGIKTINHLFGVYSYTYTPIKYN